MTTEKGHAPEPKNWLNADQSAAYVDLHKKTLLDKLAEMVAAGSNDFVLGRDYTNQHRQGYRINPVWLAGWKTSETFPVRERRKKKETKSDGG